MNEPALEIRRKKISFRATHRGIKEMDIIFGQYIDKNINKLNHSELDELEKLLDISDQKLYMWISGKEKMPPDINSQIMQKLREFKFSPEYFANK